MAARSALEQELADLDSFLREGRAGASGADGGATLMSARDCDAELADLESFLQEGRLGREQDLADLDLQEGRTEASGAGGATLGVKAEETDEELDEAATLQVKAEAVVASLELEPPRKVKPEPEVKLEPPTEVKREVEAASLELEPPQKRLRAEAMAPPQPPPWRLPQAEAAGPADWGDAAGSAEQGLCFADAKADLLLRASAAGAAAHAAYEARQRLVRDAGASSKGPPPAGAQAWRERGSGERPRGGGSNAKWFSGLHHAKRQGPAALAEFLLHNEKPTK